MQKVTVRHPEIPGFTCPAPALPPGQQQDVTRRMDVVLGQFVTRPPPLWCPGCRCAMQIVEQEEWIVGRVPSP